MLSESVSSRPGQEIGVDTPDGVVMYKGQT